MTNTNTMTGKEKMMARLEQIREEARLEQERRNNAVGIERLIYDMEDKETAQTKKRQDLEQKARDAKNKEEELGHMVRYYKKIKDMAGWSSKPTLDWTVKEGDVTHLKDYAWRMYHELQTPQIDVDVILSERTDMKKFKYQVTVTGSKTRAESGYQDRDAVKKLTHTWMEVPGSTRWDYVQDFGTPDMEMKFSKLEDAQEFVKQWRDIINKGFAKELKQDRKFFKVAKEG